MSIRWGNCTDILVEDFITEPIVGWSNININGDFVEIFSKNIESFDCECLIVCFSAAVPSREVKQPPFFSGLKISDTLKYPLIAISDPSLSMSEKVSLGWYAGNTTQPHLQQTLRKFLDIVTSAVTGKVIVIGGSGGGFASLACNIFDEPSKFNTIVWNPQVSITDYYSSFVERYTKHCWRFSSENYPLDTVKKFDALNITHNLKNHNFRTEGKIVYLQNLSDSSHYKTHCMSFVLSFGMVEVLDKECIVKGFDKEYINVFKKDNLEVKIADWGKGHISPSDEILLSEIKKIVQTPEFF